MGAKNRKLVNEALEDHAKYMKEICDIFDRMWAESSAKNYLNFRTYIMGITGNDDIFPNGVLYKGVSDKPFYFRGETGAQDSIIPSCDSAFNLEYPRN